MRAAPKIHSHIIHIHIHIRTSTSESESACEYANQSANANANANALRCVALRVRSPLAPCDLWMRLIPHLHRSRSRSRPPRDCEIKSAALFLAPRWCWCGIWFPALICASVSPPVAPRRSVRLIGRAIALAFAIACLCLCLCLCLRPACAYVVRCVPRAARPRGAPRRAPRAINPQSNPIQSNPLVTLRVAHTSPPLPRRPDADADADADALSAPQAAAASARNLLTSVLDPLPIALKPHVPLPSLMLSRASVPACDPKPMPDPLSRSHFRSSSRSLSLLA